MPVCGGLSGAGRARGLRSAPVGRRRGHREGPDRARRLQRLVGALALVTVLAATAVAHALAVADEDAAADRLADSLAVEAQVTVTQVVGEAIAALRGAGALVDESGAVDLAGFRAYASGMLGPPIHAVGLGLVVDPAGRAAFEAQHTPIVRRRPGGDFTPVAPGEVEVHLPVVDTVSLDPRTSLSHGYDWATEPIRRNAVLAARDEGRTVVSHATRLQVALTPGFLAVQPLYRRGAPVQTVEDRRAAFVGFLAVGYDADEVLGRLERALQPGVELEVHDGGTELFGLGEPGGDLARRVAVELPGTSWEVVVEPAVGPDRSGSTALLIGGTASLALLVALLVVSGRYQQRLRQADAANQQVAARLETLEALASRLSQSLSSGEVAETVLRQLRAYTGTTAGAVLGLDPDGAALELLAADGYPEADVTALARVELTGRSALATVVHTGEPVWASSPLAWADDPVLARFGAPGQAAAVVPLRAGRRVAGVLVLVHPGVRSFYPDERGLLTTVGALAGRALVRARRYDAEHDAAVVLQRALLPDDLAAHAAVSVAVRYLPARGLAVGGDFYDVFDLPGGRLALVVGDVVGRGVRAAAAMGQLRSALRALSAAVSEPAALLAAFERHTATIPDAACATMVYAVLDPEAGTLDYVRVGHPPPVLVSADGTARLLDGAGSPPLGVTGGRPISPAREAVGPGDSIVLFTDGVVERRGEPVTAGLERLRRAAARAAGLSPEACCDRLVAEVLGGTGHGDDAAVLAVRLEPVGVAGTGRAAARRDGAPAAPAPAAASGSGPIVPSA